MTLGTGSTQVAISANAVGSGGKSVGAITLKGTTLSFSTAGLALNATGGTTGAGGTVSVTTTAGTMTAGTATSLIISAIGGSTSGAGGSITLSSSGALAVTS